MQEQDRDRLDFLARRCGSRRMQSGLVERSADPAIGIKAPGHLTAVLARHP